MTQVFLVGDVRLNREALADLIERDGRLDVRAHADASDVGLLQRTSVDVIVVDTSGIDARERVRRIVANSDTPIVVLGAPDDDEHVIALAELGVIGFVERDGALDELVAMVEGAARGEAGFPARIATLLLRRVSTLGAPRAAVDATGLTMRERQVVELIGQGLSNKEIGGELCIEVATVKNHVHNILEKLGVDRRFDAVVRLRLVEQEAVEPGLRSIGP